ncbi:unnamed protein product [Peronospora destructor]|uniref:Uncharacterized protein n=1 Tax=Peronospora destructor TaxID=86335 RepID=A0AAV0V4K4_9STRA|nr:unnamed protein product [Peronospora destructor]
MESRHKRVQQKGRFTITEIIPGSPCSSHISSPMLLEEEISVTVDSTPNSYSEVATMQSQSLPQQQLSSIECNNTIEPVTNGFVQMKVEEMTEPQTQPAEAALVSISASVILAPKTKAIAMESTHGVLSTSSALNAGSVSGPSSLRKYSSPKKSRDGMQRARRIKHRGRFTIIEMAFDSPPYRKDSDELYDHRFVTTTSIGGSLVGSRPQQPSRNIEAMERRTKPKRATRSTPRLRQPLSMRRSRRQSESPACESIESVDVVDPTGSQQRLQAMAACAELQALSVTDSMTLASAVAAGTGAVATPHASVPVSKTGLTFLDSEKTVAATTSASLPPTPPSRLVNVSEKSSSIVGLPQSPSTSISAAQYLQQQQTIALLIRQQHDLKQIIGVLQEQQQQLLSIPSHINELKSQTASLYVCDMLSYEGTRLLTHVCFLPGNSNTDQARDDETRELCMKVNSLTLANESLHSLLHTAEQEVRHRNLQIECLSEENDELRQRCGQLELFLQPRD